MSFFLEDKIAEFYGQADRKIEICAVLNMEMEMRPSRIPQKAERRSFLGILARPGELGKVPK